MSDTLSVCAIILAHPTFFELYSTSTTIHCAVAQDEIIIKNTKNAYVCPMSADVGARAVLPSHAAQE